MARKLNLNQDVPLYESLIEKSDCLKSWINQHKELSSKNIAVESGNITQSVLPKLNRKELSHNFRDSEVITFLQDINQDLRNRTKRKVADAKRSRFSPLVSGLRIRRKFLLRSCSPAQISPAK